LALSFADTRIAYLTQFYSLDQIERYCAGSEERLEELYDDTQPIEVDIETLGEVNFGTEYLCDSPDGWVSIEQWRNKGTKKTFEVRLANGTFIVASHDHLFQKPSGEWVYTRDLRKGDMLLVRDGASAIVCVHDTGDQVVYDLAIGHENHRYYTNDISSHNSGKSLFLQNLALNWVFMGLNVAYITLELSEELTALRLDAMVTGKGTSDVFRKMDETALVVARKGRSAGSLAVKKLPEAGTTANDVRAYLKEYEIKTGKRFDAFLIDYLDLMHPSNRRIDPSDMFVKDKYSSEEMRSLAHETNCLCVTASQLNRCVSLDTVVDEENRGAVRIDTLAVGDRIRGPDGYVSVKEVFPVHKQKAYRVKTKSGKVIVCSANHRFPTERGLLSIDTGLNVGSGINTCEVVEFDDEIVSIEEIDEMQMLIDIEVDSEDHLFYANGLLTHNSSVEAQEFDHSHIAGGISKINTADNVFGIFTSTPMRERGIYQIQFLKTRSSSAVGQKIELAYDPVSMRISDPDVASEVIRPASTGDLRGVVKKSPSADGPAPKASAPAPTMPSSMPDNMRKRLMDLTNKVRTSTGPDV
jgi:hypothetical protein